MNKRCGLLFDKRYFDHKIDGATPENPRRIRQLYRTIQKNYKDQVHFLSPREASLQEIENGHSAFYIQQLREHAMKPDPFSYDKDTYLMRDSLPTAQLAVGGCFQIADSIMQNELDYGFALIRPPGHHAEPGRGMGFCILNNIGITARYLQERYGLQRILILDFDVHHGNGTQEMFYDSNEVLVLSLHQQGLFPFSGGAEEIGKEQGVGYTINIPVFSQFGDLEYTFLVGRLLQGLAEQFMPQIILVSAGYDAHKDDTISTTLLTTQWYHTITTMLKQYAHECCDNRLMYILEGGYNPVSLEASVLATLESLLAPDAARVGVLHAERAGQLLHGHPLHKYWTL